MSEFSSHDSDGKVLADIRELLFIIADVLAGSEHTGGATAKFERFMDSR